MVAVVLMEDVSKDRPLLLYNEFNLLMKMMSWRLKRWLIPLKLKKFTNKTNLIQDNNKKQQGFRLSFGKSGPHQPIKYGGNKV